LPTSAAACSDYGQMFNNAHSLLKITLPTAPSAAASFNSTFALCYKLQEITIPPGYVFSTMGTMCANCYSLKTFTWTPGTQNSLTTLNNAFSSCYLLTSITMPSSMNLLSNLVTAFSNCRSLLTLTLPSTLNAVTSMQQCFQGCTALTSVTLPTSMSACTTFLGTFNSCRSITSITMPNTVGAVTTFSSCFSSCYNLKTCVLPGAAQLSAVNNLDQMFYLNSNLTTVTNFEKIGAKAATPLITAADLRFSRFESGSAISFSGPLNQVLLGGQSATQRSGTRDVRFLNTSSGQWGGSAPQINLSYTNMSSGSLVTMFNDLVSGSVVTAKTMSLLGAAYTGSAAERATVTAKGWTISL